MLQISASSILGRGNHIRICSCFLTFFLYFCNLIEEFLAPQVSLWTTQRRKENFHNRNEWQEWGQEFTVSGTRHLALDLAQIQHDLHSLCIASLSTEVLQTQQGAPLQSVLGWLGLWFRHTDNCLSGKKLKQVLQFSFEHLNAWVQSRFTPKFTLSEPGGRFFTKMNCSQKMNLLKTFVQWWSYLDKS